MSRNILKISAASVAVLFALSMPSYADDAGPAYTKSMEKMNADMKKGMDPDPTKAWAKMMVAHHQGAIEMSQTVRNGREDGQGSDQRADHAQGLDRQARRLNSLNT